MKKVIIISYFFPPCQLTGGNRAGYWATNFYKHGIFPIIITRRWDNKIESFDDISKPTINKEIVIKDEKKTIYYLPHIPTSRDEFLNRNKNKFSLIRKCMSLFEIFYNNLHIKFSLSYNFYKKANQLLEYDKSISTVIISAMPFNNFFIGYTLKKKFPNLHWIADYRDEWTSRNKNIPVKEKIVNYYDKFFEKKWVSTARFITYVDNYYIDDIKKAANNPNGIVIRNGFLKEQSLKVNKKKLTIVFTFAGTLYHDQNIECFGKFLETYSKEKSNISFKINFLGSTINNRIIISNKIRKAFSQGKIELNLTERVSKEELFGYYEKSNFLLMFPFKDKKGALPTKVLNYLPLKIPILFYPSDNGAIENLIKNIDFGYATNQDKQLYNILENEILNKNQNILNINDYRKKILQYSAQGQLVKLSKAIKEIND